MAVFGRHTIIDRYWMPGEGWLSNGQALPTVTAGCILTGALILTIISALRGPWILRAFLVFAGLELAASLVDGVSPSGPIWVALQAGIGMRYFLYPIAAWVAVVVALVCDRHVAPRAIGVALMTLVVTVAIPADYVLPAQGRSNFHNEAKVFDKSPAGTIMAFPIRPMNLHAMLLVKH